MDLKVFYTWPQAVKGFDDPDFKGKIEWDIPLLEGYSYELVENISKNPSSKNWKGIDNPSLIKKVKEFNPNAILIFGWKFKSHFALMRHFKGKVPVWFRGDSTLLDYAIQSFKQIIKSSNRQFDSLTVRQIIKFKIRQSILTFVYRNIDKAFYVGTNSKNYFKAHGLKENQLVLAPHAIDNDRFTNYPDAETKAHEWRTELGIKPEEKVILFAGKLEAKKNPVLLLKAIQKLNHSTPITQNSPLTTHYSKLTTHYSKLKLLFLGSGPLETQLKELANNDPNIIFLPFQNQSQMPLVYRLADVFCLPSQGPEETWGLAVNEALASGRPVLVSDKVGCTIDLVNPNVGKIFQSNNMENLIIKLQEVLQQNITPAVCQKHIESWSFEAICKSIEEEMNIFNREAH